MARLRERRITQNKNNDEPIQQNKPIQETEKIDTHSEPAEQPAASGNNTEQPATEEPKQTDRREQETVTIQQEQTSENTGTDAPGVKEIVFDAANSPIIPKTQQDKHTRKADDKQHESGVSNENERQLLNTHSEAFRTAVRLPANIHANIIDEVQYNTTIKSKLRDYSKVVYDRLSRVMFNPAEEYFVVVNKADAKLKKVLRPLTIAPDIHANILQEQKHNIDNGLINDNYSAVVISRLTRTMFVHPDKNTPA